ncbi:UDP-N-acetylmuramoyl-tripeptide--D-alanyl-D-alanine ligase [Halioglobus maricola]|uniref:UDP-N-acetylmuramoyl-tripeptide--D-alanyl-D-alanine ligase n=1 Tax=Halioglobus maricola TaxID=2601894 RepID=A0A5P9NJ35_9GAMM|nr:UDP-N-acetylmuramoyl-tripeptide--D-alanyl-D-alanine ligase [Halioglobus maricola]QFU74978.1 UDP-N-acetylmuramoyl-tripeptide--D-alanyl-D-alanine ligase [Halioglobus maricola]
MMRSFSLAELCEPLNAILVGGDCRIDSVCTDSRELKTGDLFVALSGDNFDGHNYLDVAANAGAAAVMISRESTAALPQLQVADTQRGLGLLGAYNRAQFSGPLVAITGSAGKTTVKNIVHAVLSQRGETLATDGNFNNEVGVPLTLLRLGPGDEFAVVEMGAAGKGHIEWLCEIGKPTVSLLLNAMPAHLDGFGSVEQIADAKAEIYDALGTQGVAVINADQAWADAWRARAGEARVIDFSTVSSAAAVHLLEARSLGIEGSELRIATPVGEFVAMLALPGPHNHSNALAAVAVGLACGLELAEIAAGLAAVQPVAGRLAAVRNASGALVIDDSYNANPGSVKAAIETLIEASGRRTLVLGVMRELGPESAMMHRQMGEFSREAGLDQFWGVGEELREAVEVFGSGGRWFEDCDQALAAGVESFGPEDAVLVKGSRGARMERVVNGLTALASAGER